jgi:hypothetical protein
MIQMARPFLLWATAAVAVAIKNRGSFPRGAFWVKLGKNPIAKDGPIRFRSVRNAKS